MADLVFLAVLLTARTFEVWSYRLADATVADLDARQGEAVVGVDGPNSVPSPSSRSPSAMTTKVASSLAAALFLDKEEEKDVEKQERKQKKQEKTTASHRSHSTRRRPGRCGGGGSGSTRQYTAARVACGRVDADSNCGLKDLVAWLNEAHYWAATTHGPALLLFASGLSKIACEGERGKGKEAKDNVPETPVYIVHHIYQDIFMIIVIRY